jgi:hypothetical protein
MPDFADLHQQPQRHPHLTQQLLWGEVYYDYVCRQCHSIVLNVVWANPS